MKTTTASEIAKKGFLTVNLPITLLMVASWYLLMRTEYFNSKICAVISFAIGWIYWEFAVNKWIRWSLSQKIEKEELYKIGKRNLLLWNDRKIHKVAEKMKW